MEALQPVAAIVLVLALLGGALFLLKRRGMATFTGSAGRPRQLELIERVALDAQHSIHLVRVGGRSVLIATAPGQCQILDYAHTLERS